VKNIREVVDSIKIMTAAEEWEEAERVMCVLRRMS
jgi:hypothetical protein